LTRVGSRPVAISCAVGLAHTGFMFMLEAATPDLEARGAEAAALRGAVRSEGPTAVGVLSPML
jgi:hypothetical protein